MNEEILRSYGAIVKNLEKGEYLFYEGDKARNYFQVQEGRLKMFNVSEEGKEFTQGYFEDGESLGEPPLLLHECYPASAAATQPTTVYKLTGEHFQKLLKEHPEAQAALLMRLARRLYSKSTSLRNLANTCPEARIVTFLDSYKKHAQQESRVRIPYTRQEIANATGLRVETVIRTLSALNQMKRVAIINRKLYY